MLIESEELLNRIYDSILPDGQSIANHPEVFRVVCEFESVIREMIAEQDNAYDGHLREAIRRGEVSFDEVYGK